MIKARSSEIEAGHKIRQLNSLLKCYLTRMLSDKLCLTIHTGLFRFPKISSKKEMPRGSRDAPGLQWREQSNLSLPPLRDFCKEWLTQSITNSQKHKYLEWINSIATLFLPGLQSTDGVDFCDVDNCSEGLESSTAALSHLRSIRKKVGYQVHGYGAGRHFGRWVLTSCHQSSNKPLQEHLDPSWVERSRLCCDY